MVSILYGTVPAHGSGDLLLGKMSKCTCISATGGKMANPQPEAVWAFVNIAYFETLVIYCHSLMLYLNIFTFTENITSQTN